MNFRLKTYRLPAAVSLLALALLPACTTPDTATAPDPAAAAEEAVMARHDTLMAQTGQLFELKQRLRKSSAAPAVAAPYIHGLESANGTMMSWMHQYQVPDSTAPAAQRLAYFEGQQVLLTTVATRMRGTIDSAQAFLRALPESQVGGK